MYTVGLELAWASLRVPGISKCLRPSLILLILAMLGLVTDSAVGQITTRVSLGASGTQGNSNSFHPSISADGRYVAFFSYATNLVPGDTNGSSDVFVHDRQTGQTTRVSVDSSGGQGNERSHYPSLSADGRYVAFDSYATNLVGDTNRDWDVFVHDRQTGQTTRVSVDSSGGQGNNGSFWPSISAGGRYVAFSSSATNLVPGDTNGYLDVLVHDRQTGQTTRASVFGAQGNGDSLGRLSISADGSCVAFNSYADNLVPGDTNGDWDVFVHDRQTGQTTRVSVDASGAQGNGGSYYPSITADARFVAFASDAPNLVPGDTNGVQDVFVHDRQTGRTTRVSVDASGAEGDNDSAYPSITADGRYVAFYSDASNLVPGDTNWYVDVFVHDRQTGQITRVSVDASGAEGDDDSTYPSISADGRSVAFSSLATNLVPGDTNGFADIFVRGPELTLEADPLVVSGGDVLVLTTYRGVPGNEASLWAVEVDSTPIFTLIFLGSFPADGRFVVSGIVPGGLASMALTFRGYCIGQSGSLETTNDVTVSFQ